MRKGSAQINAPSRSPRLVYLVGPRTSLMDTRTGVFVEADVEKVNVNRGAIATLLVRV
jgi:hypothetical protein